MGRVVHGVSCPRGEMSVGRNVCGAKCLWGEMSVGRNVRGAKCPWGEMSVGQDVVGQVVVGRVVRGASCLGASGPGTGIDTELHNVCTCCKIQFRLVETLYCKHVEIPHAYCITIKLVARR